MEIGIKKKKNKTKNFRNKKYFHVKKLSKLTSMKSQTDTLKDKTTDFREVNCSCYKQSANNTGQSHCLLKSYT